MNVLMPIMLPTQIGSQIGSWVSGGGSAGGGAPATNGLRDGLLSWWDMDPSLSISTQRYDLHGPYWLDGGGANSEAGLGGRTATTLTGVNRLYTQAEVERHWPNLSWSAGDRMVAGWVQMDSLAATMEIANRWGSWDGGWEWRIIYSTSSNSIKLLTRSSDRLTSPQLTSSVSLTPGGWVFIAAGRNNTTGDVFLNVTPAAEGTLNTTETGNHPSINDGSFAIEFGAANDAGKFTGAIQSWGMWDRILTNSELVDLYNAGTGLAYADLEYTTEPGLRYFHDFEQIAPNDAGTLYNYQETSITHFVADPDDPTNQVFRCLPTEDFPQVQVYSDGYRGLWAGLYEGRIRFRLYVTDWAANGMIFQIDGKSFNPEFDADQAWAMRMRTDGGKREIECGATTDGMVWEPPLNQWMDIDFRWNDAAATNTREIWVDGVLRASATTPSPVYTMPSWQHISIGNDTVVDAGFYLDDFLVEGESNLI